MTTKSIKSRALIHPVSLDFLFHPSHVNWQNGGWRFGEMEIRISMTNLNKVIVEWEIISAMNQGNPCTWLRWEKSSHNETTRAFFGTFHLAMKTPFVTWQTWNLEPILHASSAREICRQSQPQQYSTTYSCHRFLCWLTPLTPTNTQAGNAMWHSARYRCLSNWWLSNIR